MDDLHEMDQCRGRDAGGLGDSWELDGGSRTGDETLEKSIREGVQIVHQIEAETLQIRGQSHKRSVHLLAL